MKAVNIRRYTSGYRDDVLRNTLVGIFVEFNEGEEVIESREAVFLNTGRSIVSGRIVVVYYYNAMDFEEARAITRRDLRIKQIPAGYDENYRVKFEEMRINAS